MYLYKTNSNSGGETVMFTFSITLHSLKKSSYFYTIC